jgi:hypothetical protein
MRIISGKIKTKFCTDSSVYQSLSIKVSHKTVHFFFTWSYLLKKHSQSLISIIYISCVTNGFKFNFLLQVRHRYIFHRLVVQYSVSEQFNNGKLTCITNLNHVFHSYYFTAVHLQPKHLITNHVHFTK